MRARKERGVSRGERDLDECWRDEFDFTEADPAVRDDEKHAIDDG
jgi:hypothetical protein